MSLTLGSLFDGIGGFPLAARMHGITPAWASEIEAAPVAITMRHFPDMRHLGNVLEINGAEIEPVDIITFGSPCQDLSVAGKRGGLDGERSGLFMEAIRIIKEMRNATGGIRPRYCVWENVAGAFSSNKGKDFHTVLKEIVSIAEPGVSVPGSAVKGKLFRGRLVWPRSGGSMGDGWSLAWRCMDAQHWGIPQRRKRIFLVADFGGHRAGETLLKCDGLQGDSEQGGGTRQGTSADALEGADGADNLFGGRWEV